jgi:lipopolysaccharide transport system ATP-binding protein
MDPVIKIDGVSKRFKIYHGRMYSLKERLLYWGQQKSEDFWAVKDIRLSIPRGSTVGLIGRNGSGKSTLLKLISRILYPTTGQITVNGKMSTLLELGAGFHPDFTGRENIYLNASILGFSKKDIDHKLEEIIDFSELRDFIDSPVRNYSSGMYMRLGFSVAIHVNPDILLIDEILAVGDYEFQQKCMSRILQFKAEGKTIIFVSHSSDQVKKLCDIAVWLENGLIKQQGSVGKVIDLYEKRESALII